MITNGRVEMRRGLDQVASGDIIAFGSINQINLRGDFNGDIISYSGGIKSLIITDGSFRPGNRIAAYDGNLDLIRIKGGDLLRQHLHRRRPEEPRTRQRRRRLRGNIGIGVLQAQQHPLQDRHPQRAAPERLSHDRRRRRDDPGRATSTASSCRGSIWESSIIAGENIGLIDVFLLIRNDALTVGRNNVTPRATASTRSAPVSSWAGCSCSPV